MERLLAPGLLVLLLPALTRGEGRRLHGPRTGRPAGSLPGAGPGAAGSAAQRGAAGTGARQRRGEIPVGTGTGARRPRGGVREWVPRGNRGSVPRDAQGPRSALEGEPGPEPCWESGAEPRGGGRSSGEPRPERRGGSAAEPGAESPGSLPPRRRSGPPGAAARCPGLPRGAALAAVGGTELGTGGAGARPGGGARKAAALLLLFCESF